MILTPHTDDYDWGAMSWLAQGTDIGASLAIMKVAAGKMSPAHRHGNCAEIIHLTQGRVSQRIGDRWVEMSEGETAVIETGAVHQTKNLSAHEAVLTICYSSGARHYEEVTA